MIPRLVCRRSWGPCGLGFSQNCGVEKPRCWKKKLWDYPSTHQYTDITDDVFKTMNHSQENGVHPEISEEISQHDWDWNQNVLTEIEMGLQQATKANRRNRNVTEWVLNFGWELCSCSRNGQPPFQTNMNSEGFTIKPKKLVETRQKKIGFHWPTPNPAVSDCFPPWKIAISFWDKPIITPARDPKECGG